MGSTDKPKNPSDASSSKPTEHDRKLSLFLRSLSIDASNSQSTSADQPPQSGIDENVQMNSRRKDYNIVTNLRNREISGQLRPPHSKMTNRDWKLDRLEHKFKGFLSTNKNDNKTQTELKEEIHGIYQEAYNLLHKDANTPRKFPDHQKVRILWLQGATVKNHYDSDSLGKPEPLRKQNLLQRTINALELLKSWSTKMRPKPKYSGFSKNELKLHIKEHESFKECIEAVYKDLASSRKYHQAKIALETAFDENNDHILFLKFSLKELEQE